MDTEKKVDEEKDEPIEPADKEGEKDEKDKEGEEDNEDNEDPESLKPEEIDYEAELEKERGRGVPDPIKAKVAFKERQQKREEKELDDDELDDDDKPLTRSEVNRMLHQASQSAFKQANADRIQDLAKELAESDAEAAYIVEIHKNRMFPDSLSLREQVEEAHAIANRKRMKSKNIELARALGAKQTISKNSATTHRDPMTGTAPKMSAEDTAAYTRAGFVYDGKQRVWKKKLPNGTFLYKDPKSKRSWQAK